ncbi:MAG: hypothetical protein J5785_00840 [Spirochaetales bacterium]|nr:hypothetical protein [Spirochaetales bacterium]
MDKFYNYATYGMVVIGVFAITGGLFYRRTFSVIRNIIFSPLIGFFLSLLIFVPSSATVILKKLYSIVTGLVGESCWSIVKQVPGILNQLGVLDRATDWLFICGAVFSATLLGVAVFAAIRSRMLLRAQAMVVSAFIITLSICFTLTALDREFTTKAFCLTLGGLGLVMALLQKFDFDIIMMGETAVLGSLIALSPLKIKGNLNMTLYLGLAFFSAVVLFVLGILLWRNRRRRNEPKA